MKKVLKMFLWLFVMGVFFESNVTIADDSEIISTSPTLTKCGK